MPSKSAKIITFLGKFFKKDEKKKLEMIARAFKSYQEVEGNVDDGR